MTAPEFIVCGGCHVDRHLRLTAPPRPGRTNPADADDRLGGVATNIAVQLAGRGMAVRLVSVQTPDGLGAMTARLVAAGIDPWLVPLEGASPGYTAILAPDGELLMGAAAMSLYDAVSASLIRPGLAEISAPIIMDANFPAATIAGIVSEYGATRRLLAAGTSIAKVGRLAAVLPSLDALVLNRGEAATLLGQEMTVGSMASTLASQLRDGGSVLVSDGADMAALALGEAVVTAPPPRVRLVNANGAGDVMAARLFSDLTRQLDMTLAARLEAALAAGATHAAGANAEV